MALRVVRLGTARLPKEGTRVGTVTERRWATFARRYRAEMRRPAAARLLTLLAALSATGHLSVGCYCADESRCHRSLLRELLRDAGAVLAD
jgi:uncharacterized protein YeaO (DUF488 family)